MLIVSDTSPVTNLLRIEQLSILYQVFGVVILPQAVYDELCQLPQQKEVIDQLITETGFRVHNALYQQVIKSAGE